MAVKFTFKSSIVVNGKRDGILVQSHESPGRLPATAPASGRNVVVLLAGVAAIVLLVVFLWFLRR